MSSARPISQLLQDFLITLTAEPVSFDALLEAFHERGFGILLLIFALPMALPIPVPPGINIILASPLVFLTAQQMIGRHTVWFPQWLRRKKLASDTIRGLFGGSIPFLLKLEFLTRPRLEFLTQSLAQKVTGFLGLIMALTVLVPLPLTNTVPSLGIAVMAIGILMRDGLAVLAGATIGTVWVAILVLAFIFFGMEGFEIVKNTIKGFL
jgi:hypothetical protein